MKHPLDDRDLMDADRYVDATLSADDRTAFELRLRSNPALAEAVQQAEALRGIFRAARAEPAPAVREGFGARVLQRVKSEAGVTAELAGLSERQVVTMARWCVVAAAVIFTVALLLASGVLRPLDSGQLQADDEVLIQQLDQRIQQSGGIERR